MHGIGSDDPLVSYDGSGTTNPTYLLADERGSIMAETNSSGTVTTKHQYGPYGEPINQSSSRFRYTGQILLPGTELYHYKARVHHPKLGRFLQTDPIGYKDGMNWYAYVGNDPMNAVDPDGTCGTLIKGRKSVNCTVEGGSSNSKGTGKPKSSSDTVGSGQFKRDMQDYSNEQIIKAGLAAAPGTPERLAAVKLLFPNGSPIKDLDYAQFRRPQPAPGACGIYGGWAYCSAISPGISIGLDTASVGAYASGAGAPAGITLNILSAANGVATGCLCGVTPSTITSITPLAIPPSQGKLGVAVSITDALLTATGN